MGVLLDRRMALVGPGGAVLALVGAALCALVAVGALLPYPPPVPLGADGSLQVPQRPGPHPGAALYLERGTDPDVVEEVAAACGGSRYGDFRVAVVPEGGRALADGTVVEAVATAPDLVGGATVRCDAVSTDVWVGLDEGDRWTVAVLAGLLVPVCLVAAGVFLAVGHASRRRR